MILVPNNVHKSVTVYVHCIKGLSQWRSINTWQLSLSETILTLMWTEYNFGTDLGQHLLPTFTNGGRHCLSSISCFSVLNSPSKTHTMMGWQLKVDNITNKFHAFCPNKKQIQSRCYRKRARKSCSKSLSSVPVLWFYLAAACAVGFISGACRAVLHSRGTFTNSPFWK